MLLRSVHIRDYRSIQDSGEVEIDPKKTLLVGINEAGKTALLKAIQHIKPPTGTEALSALRDYPRARYTEIQRGTKESSEVIVAEALFDLNDDEKTEVSHLAPQSTNVNQLTVYRYLDGSLKWNFGASQRLYISYGDIENDVLRLRAYLAKQTDAEEIVAALDTLIKVRKASTPLKGHFASDLQQWLTDALPFMNEADKKENDRWSQIRTAASFADEISAAGRAMVSRLPLFVYYSTYFTVRPRINLNSLAIREEAGDLDGEYDFGNLCLLQFLGFTARELSDLADGEPCPENYQGGQSDQGYRDAVAAYQEKLDDRQYRLNAASVDLTKSIREVWGDEQVTLSLRADGQYLKVVVVDDVGVEVELDQRSEGFRWLVSFFVVFKAQAQGELKNAILLLDEPGLSLHALKQQEFRRTITRLATDNQVIYTTHSPFMVGTDELDLVRIVEMVDRSTGTKVHSRLVIDDPKSIYPLQAALGYELAQSLFGQRRNLVCEGLTDMMYVEALNAGFSDQGKGFKHEVALVPASSASKVVYYSTVLVSQRLKVAALLDSDQAGNNAAKQNELVALLTSKRILRTHDYCPNTVRNPEIEDLLRTTLLQVAKDDLGWDVTSTAAAQPSRQLVDIFDKEISVFSKYKLVRAFIRWMSTHEITDLDASEVAAVEAFFKDVNKALA